MQFGTRRVMVRWGLFATALMMAGGTSAFAQGWNLHTIPREVPAMDYRTGDVMQAPAIPYGEYAKDYVGAVHGAIGTASGMVHGSLGKVCALCGGAACGQCGGCGLFGGHACGNCGGDGCPRCDGHGRLLACDPSQFASAHAGLLGGGVAPGAVTAPATGHGLFGLLHHGAPGVAVPTVGTGAAGFASPQVPSSQAAGTRGATAMACPKCHGRGLFGAGPCGLCGGRGAVSAVPCNHCHGAGCDACGGKGLVDPNACANCGGAGCSACEGTGLAHHLLGAVQGAAASMLHRGDIRYFVGAGGPVPLTPGYVPYVVTTRSPRDYFAFPPFVDQAQP